MHGIVSRVWWFFSGLTAGAWRWLTDLAGRTHVHSRPFWVVFGDDGHDVSARHIRRALACLCPGDVVLRGYRRSLLGFFIPGRFSHSGVYVGAGTVVHALSSGVQTTDVLDFFMGCDRLAVLHPSQLSPAAAEMACRVAREYVGTSYDYAMDICEDCGADRRCARSVYCHELTRMCYPGLRVSPVEPQLWNGMIRSSRRQYLAQSFLDSPDFEVAYDSFYSEPH